MSLPMCLCDVLVCVEHDYVHVHMYVWWFIGISMKMHWVFYEWESGFSKWNYDFMRFCIRGHLLKLYMGHLLRAKAPQSATHGAKCHNCRICILLKENEKVWMRQKEVFMNLFTIFPKDHGISSICIIYKYVCILV